MLRLKHCPCTRVVYCQPMKPGGRTANLPVHLLPCKHQQLACQPNPKLLPFIYIIKPKSGHATHHGLPGGSRTPRSLRPLPLLSDSSSGSGVCTKKYSTSASPLLLLWQMLLTSAPPAPAAPACRVGLPSSRDGPPGRLLPLYKLLLRGLLAVLATPAAAVGVLRRIPSCSCRGRLMQPA